MNDYLVLKFLHLLAFVYWLGGDLGTFLASRQVVNGDNTPAARHVALKIMLACDMGPKLAMPLILPLGVHLAAMGGWLAAGPGLVAAAWAVGLYWAVMVLVLYLNEGKPFAARLSRLDFWFRVVVALGIAGAAISSRYGSSIEMADWVALKLLVFAAMVGCGILIRVNLAPFVPAFGAMMGEGPSDEGNRVMRESIGRCRPWVWAIWAGLFLNAALGLHLVSF